MLAKCGNCSNGTRGSRDIIFAREINESDNPEATRKEKIDEYREEFSKPYVAAGLGMVDVLSTT